MARNYRSTADAKTLSSDVAAAAVKMTLNNLTNLPSPPYIMVLNPDTVNEEAVLVTSVDTGTTLNISRAVETGQTAKDHTAGNTVRHMIVGSDLQTLNDSFTSYASDTKTFTNKTIALGSNTVSGTKAQFNTALTDGDFATQAGTETLTNKTVNLSDNAVTGTVAQFNTALSDGDFATLAGTETFTNKTLTSPKLNEDVTLTSTSTELNTVHSSGVTNADLVKLHAVTATSTELNKLAGATATTTELNYVSGVTSPIQTQLSAKAVAGSNHIPYKMAAGSTGISASSAGASSYTGTLDLTSYGFDYAPIITATCASSSGAGLGATVRFTSISTTAANWTIQTTSGTTGTVSFHWHAVQMTSTGSAG